MTEVGYFYLLTSLLNMHESILLRFRRHSFRFLKKLISYVDTVLKAALVKSSVRYRVLSGLQIKLVSTFLVTPPGKWLIKLKLWIPCNAQKNHSNGKINHI